MSFMEQALAEVSPNELLKALVAVDSSKSPGRKPAANLPTIAPGGTSAVRTLRYEAEKAYGIRRENGARKLRKLTHRHYNILARHLAGQSCEQISNDMHLSISTISRVLNDPLAVEVLQNTYKNRQAELDALLGDAIDGVRGALKHGSTSEKLAGVDKYVKLKGAVAPDTAPSETAEDFARAIIRNAENVQINIGTRP